MATVRHQGLAALEWDVSAFAIWDGKYKRLSFRPRCIKLVYYRTLMDSVDSRLSEIRYPGGTGINSGR